MAMFSLLLVGIWGTWMTSADARVLYGCVFHAVDLKSQIFEPDYIPRHLCSHLFLMGNFKDHVTALKQLCNMKDEQDDLQVIVGHVHWPGADEKDLIKWTKSVGCEIDGIILTINTPEDMKHLNQTSRYLWSKQLQLYIEMYVQKDEIDVYRKAVKKYSLAGLVDGVLAHGPEMGLMNLGDDVIPVPPAVTSQGRNEPYVLEDIIHFWESLGVPSNLLVGEIPHVLNSLYLRRDAGEKDPIGTQYIYKSIFNPAITCLDKSMKKVIHKAGYGYSFNRTHLATEIFPEVAKLFTKRMSAAGFQGFISYTFPFEIQDLRCYRQAYEVMEAAKKEFTEGNTKRRSKKPQS